MSRPSPAFICALIGVATTLLGWYGPWAWPAIPGFFVLQTVFGRVYEELALGLKAAILVLAIVVNVGAWGAVAFGIMMVTRYPNAGRIRPSP